MFIETIAVGTFRCNCTIIGCEATRKAIVVDPGDEPERIAHIIRANGLDVSLVVHTHAHLDHVMGSFAVVEETGARARLHENDRLLWENIHRVAASYHIPPPRMPPLAEALEDGEVLSFGSEAAQVIHTPGHTMGSCCFNLKLDDGRGLLLSGDTLFRGKIGFASPALRQKNLLIASIRNRLLSLDDNTLVIPGHGPTTEIGIERRHNPFLTV